MMRTSTSPESPPATFEQDAAGGVLSCAGTWTVDSVAAMEPVLSKLSVPNKSHWWIDGSGLTMLDTAGAWLLHRTCVHLRREGAIVELRGLRPEHASLLAFLEAQEGVAVHTVPSVSLLERIGRGSVSGVLQAMAFLAFVGESAVAIFNTVRHPRRIRGHEVLHNLQLAGFDALPIAGLLSFLMGVVIAYQGATQLLRYGANIFIADLVGLSILRELAPLMTAIIIAGRSGSAYTAQIGTMMVTEEVDALRTIGIAPMDLLVLPKLFALMLALPLLTVYADIMGVFGGMVVAKAQLGVGFNDFLDRFADAVSLSSYMVGIGKAPVFAALIALVGCFQGFQVGGSADSVGRQTTLSVVQGIFLVIVADAAFSVAFSNLDL
jgi:phospholipid/cholesterol/gamma-HCH transport system permease protein